MGEDLIDISNTCTGLLQDCYDNDMQYDYNNGIVMDESYVINHDQGRQGWYKYVNINSIGISYQYYISMYNSWKRFFKKRLKLS